MRLDEWEWTCGCCGERHRGVPELSFEGPLAWHRAPGDPAIRVTEKSSDFCTLEIDGRVFTFVRCVLPVPLAFLPGESFCFGVWSTLSQANAARYRESFDADDQSRLGAMFGYLGNRLPGYPDTENFHLDVWPRDAGARPEVWLRSEHEGHPLHRDQAEGWDEARLAAMLAPHLPCDGRA